MTAREKIEDSLVKFYSYLTTIITDYDIARLKVGDLVLADKSLFKSVNLEVIIYLLEYSLDWLDTDNETFLDDSPLTMDDVNSIINKGVEIVKVTIELPLI